MHLFVMRLATPITLRSPEDHQNPSKSHVPPSRPHPPSAARRRRQDGQPTATPDGQRPQGPASGLRHPRRTPARPLPHRCPHRSGCLLPSLRRHRPPCYLYLPGHDPPATPLPLRSPRRPQPRPPRQPSDPGRRI